ncbi:MAG: hypothetical protein KTR31_38260 [Myxococcales bacterium]|nr:hypothetical protein [Myxococcales bacterium]
MNAPWQAALTASILGLISGCWKDDFARIPAESLAFRPEGTDAPEGWAILGIDTALDCPDGQTSRFYLLHPTDPGSEPIAGAVLYHSGSFDFVFSPDATAPLDGDHLADPARLSSEWSFQQVFATLGMHPDVVPGEVHDGLLPARLAEAGVAVMLPANCWGDLWAARRGVADNDFGADFFYREGRAAAEWGFRVLADPAFALALGIELPVTIDPEQVYAVGLGEGSRAVLEMLSIDNDEDGQGDYSVAGALLDSAPDDLRYFYDNEGQFPQVMQGLRRIFPGGPAQTTTGSVFSADVLPTPLVYVYSSSDPALPAQVHTAAVDRISGREGVSVFDVGSADHVFVNRADHAGLLDEAITALLSAP